MRVLKHIFIIIALSGVHGMSNAALPVAVDGQALPTLAPMLENVHKSVVSITSEIQQRANDNRFYDDPFFRRFFDNNQTSRNRNRQLAAVGVIVDAQNGYILTNEHSIAGATNIVVTLPDGREVMAQMVGVDKVADVAVIKVAAENLTQIAIGNSDALRVGDFVVSVGDPLGNQSTITSGLVSAISKKSALKNHQHFIQSDAGFGPGVLVNLNGDLIGLNIARVAETAGSTRIGFSTPINLAMKIKQQIVDYGVPQRGSLAVQVQDLTPQLAKAFNIPEQRGAVITQVANGSSAELSGIKVGDVILKVENQFINRSSDLRSLVGYHFADDSLEMEVLRDGKQQRLSAVLESSTRPSRIGTMIHHKLDGATFKEVSVNQSDIPIKEGVLTTNVKKGSVAWHNGVRANDLILSANRKSVSSLDEFRSAINDKDVLMLNILRENGALFLLLQ